jgi:hypothetical protein
MFTDPLPSNELWPLDHRGGPMIDYDDDDDDDDDNNNNNNNNRS